MDCLQEAKTEIASQQVHTGMLETQKKRVFSTITANFDVEKKTFVDPLLGHLKCILLEGHIGCVERHVVRSKEILDHANEDKHVGKLREKLIAKEKRPEECMFLLHGVPLPSKKVRVE